LIEIINKQLLLQLVGYLCYWQMGFNSVFKGLNFSEKFKRAQSRNENAGSHWARYTCKFTHINFSKF